MRQPNVARDAERLVHAEIRRALAENGVRPTTLASRDLLVGGLGLTSAQLVAVAARLAMRLGVDPFAGSTGFTDIRTVGDLVRMFDAVASGASARQSAPDDLAAARRRAEARRDRRPR